MSVCKIFEDGNEINRIVADEDFAKEYCAANGYTYEMEPEPEPPAREPGYSDTQILGQQVTDLELSQIQMEQRVAALEIAQAGAKEL